MADELQYYGNPDSDTGLTITAKVYDSAGAQVGSDASCSEVGALAIYIGDMPTASAGVYAVRFFSSGDFVAHGVLEWDGANEITNAMIDTVADGIKSVTDNLPDSGALNNLDAAVSTRLASSGYTAPDNASITSILADTNELQTNQGDWVTATGFATPADVTASQTALTTEIDANEAKIDTLTTNVAAIPTTDSVADITPVLTAIGNLNDISSADVTAAVPTTAEIEAALLNEGDGQQLIDAIVQAIGNSNVDEIALVAAIRADIERSGGLLDLLPVLSEIEASSVLAKATDIAGLNDITASDVVTAMQVVANDFKADVSGLSTLTAAQVNAEVDTALADYDAPTKAELDATEASIIAALSTDEMTESELHAALDSYTNKADWKASYSLTAAAVRTELTTELARIDANTSSRSTFDPATDTVATVTTVTNMRGTDNANTVAPDNASIAAILTDTNELQTNQNNWLTADISGIETKAQADSRQTALIAEHDATQSAIAGIASYDDTTLIGKVDVIDSNVDAIKAKTDTLVNTDLTGIALTSDIATSQAAIIAAMPAPIKMTEIELHSFLDSYTNKADWKSDVSLLATSTALSSVAVDVGLAISLSA